MTSETPGAQPRFVLRHLGARSTAFFLPLILAAAFLNVGQTECSCGHVCPAAPDPPVAVQPGPGIMSVDLSVTLPTSGEISTVRFFRDRVQIGEADTVLPDYDTATFTDASGLEGGTYYGYTASYYAHSDGLVSGGSSTTNILIEAAPPGWGTPQSIQSMVPFTGFPPLLAFEPDVALNPSGEAVAVWPHRFDMWASDFTPGVGWSTPVLIDTPDYELVGHPQIEIDAEGNAIAAWSTDPDFAGAKIWANRFTQAGDWGGAQLIGSDDDPRSSRGFVDSLAMDSSGNAIVVWAKSTGPDPNNPSWNVKVRAMAVHYTVGGTWSQPVAIDGLDTLSDRVTPGCVDVEMDANGNAVAVWSQQGRSTSGTLRGSENGYWAAHYTPNGGWGIPTQIFRPFGATFIGGGPHIAVDAAGNAAVVVTTSCEYFCTTYDLSVIRHKTGDWRWGSPQLLSQGSIRWRTILASDTGDVFVVWNTGEWNGSTVEEASVWAQRFSQGEWEPAENIYPGAGNPPVTIDVDEAWRWSSVADVDSTGNAVVAFRALRPDMEPSMHASRYTAASGWEAPIPIEDDGPQLEPTVPAIAVANSGPAMCVWAEVGSTLRDIWTVDFYP